MAPKLILHVGDPKTGSSSIQRVLFERRFSCETVSLDYPEVLSSLALAHVLERDGTEEQVADRYQPYGFWLDNSRADVAVISAEQFSTINPRKLEAACRTHLAAHAAGMTVLAYAKPHPGRLLSAYAQRVKVGQVNRSIDRFYRELAQTSALHMHPRFIRWRGVFGDRLLVRPMVRGELFHGDVVADFLNVALGGAAFTISGSTEANVSLPVEALAGLRLVQSVLRNHEIEAGLRQAVGDTLNTLVTATPNLKGTKLTLDRALAERLRTGFLDESRAMDRDFFAGRPIMESAMDAAVEGAVAEPIPTEPSAHLGPRALQRLRRLTQQLADSFAQHPGAWVKAHRRDKGRLTLLREDEVRGQEVPAAVAEAEALLADMARILARACRA